MKSPVARDWFEVGYLRCMLNHFRRWLLLAVLPATSGFEIWPAVMWRRHTNQGGEEWSKIWRPARGKAHEAAKQACAVRGAPTALMPMLRILWKGVAAFLLANM